MTESDFGSLPICIFDFGDYCKISQIHIQIQGVRYLFLFLNQELNSTTVHSVGSFASLVSMLVDPNSARVQILLAKKHPHDAADG